MNVNTVFRKFEKHSKLFKILAVALIVLALLSNCVVAAPTETEDLEDSNNYGTVIGIDLGTTYSCVGVMKNGRYEIIANDMGNRITPSYVAFTDTQRLIGDSAKYQSNANPLNTVHDAKRLIGKKFHDPTVQKDMKDFPFKIVNVKNKPFIEVTYKGEVKRFAPEEISAMVLSKMKEIAEAYLGHSVTHAVVTVPAYFDDSQKASTKDAGTIAGLNVIRLLNEPTAAAIAYGLDNSADNGKEKNIIVYDLGGGTFDVSLLTLDSGVFEVLAVNGDTHLGGEDFDQRVIDFFVKKFKKQHGPDMDLKKDEKAIAKLKKEIEKAKRSLSSATQVKIEIENIMNGVDLSEQLSRARFEQLNQDLFRKTMEPLKQVLKDSGMKKNEIDEIVLVGGSTRIPKIQEMVSKFFNGKQVSRGINPDEAVAIGAAIQGAILNPSQSKLKNDMIVIDATPLSLGIETVGQVMSVLIPKNTPYPTNRKQVFSTYTDNQNTVTIQVFQGERAKTSDNIFLGKFNLDGIPNAPRGVPQIEVTFSIDANGILSVSAVCTQNGIENSITIERDESRPSEEIIQEMMRAAQEYEFEDQQFKAMVEAKNTLESQAYRIQSQIENNELSLPSEEHEQVLLDACTDAIEWLEEKERDGSLDDIGFVDEMKEKLQEFTDIVSPILGQSSSQQQYDDSSHQSDDYYSDHFDL